MVYLAVSTQKPNGVWTELYRDGVSFGEAVNHITDLLYMSPASTTRVVAFNNAQLVIEQPTPPTTVELRPIPEGSARFLYTFGVGISESPDEFFKLLLVAIGFLERRPELFANCEQELAAHKIVKEL